eukprot:TRINITY_DN1832_c2_g3_i3.p1 TRINITY_DN1832_c2_g3~~TRINITY_DN1832_c2_g3_i3.p1  ORF type:complete len:553 (+),score=199.68 TRINITY_DN1832_c2_g3_i3:1-1659(+)
MESGRRGTVEAVRQGDLVLLDKIITDAPDLLYYRDPSGWSLLHHAVATDQIECAKCLLNSGIDARMVDKNNHNVFHFAAKENNVQMMNILMELGMELDIDEALKEEDFVHYDTPLQLACRYDREDAVLFLAQRFPFLLNSSDVYGRTPLSVAIDARQNPRLIVSLVEMGARVQPNAPKETVAPLEMSLINGPPINLEEFRLKETFNNPKTSDITFHLDGVEMYGVKEILKAKCENLPSQWTSDETQSVEIPKVSPEIFRSFLHWIHFGTLETNRHLDDANRDLFDLWDMAHMYGCRDLHRHVQHLLVSRMESGAETTTLDSIRDLFEQSYIRRSRYLTRFCACYLLDHPQDLLEYFKLKFNLKTEEERREKEEEYLRWLFCAMEDDFSFQVGNSQLENQLENLQLEKREEGSLLSIPSHLFSAAYQYLFGTTVPVQLEDSQVENQVENLQLEKEDDFEDFPVQHVNWYWRKQERIVRVFKLKIQRIVPVTFDVRSTHALEDITKIVFREENMTIIYRDAPLECYQLSNAHRLYELMQSRCPNAEIQWFDATK